MSNLRRYYSDGNYYFVTTVTKDRQPILIRNFDLYKTAIDRTGKRFEFQIIAWIVLPEHLHLIIDPLSNDLSKIMQRFKQDFRMLYRQTLGKQTGRVW